MKLRLIPAALVAVSALSLSLLSPVAATAAPDTNNPVEVTGLKMYRSSQYEQRINTSSTVSMSLAINVATLSGFTLEQLTADVYVAGRKRTTINLPKYPTARFGVSWTRAYGPGATQLRNIKATGRLQGSTTSQTYNLPTVSNTVRVKRAREASSFFISKYGSKMSFSVYGYRAYQKNGKLAPARKVNLQRRVGKKWKQVKRFAVKRNGITKFTISNSSKYKYRIIIKGTKLVDGVNAVTRKKI